MRSARLFLRNQKPGGFFFSFFLMLLLSCSNPAAVKKITDSINDSIAIEPTSPAEISEDQIHRYLAEMDMESGQGDFILAITGSYNYDKNKIIAFSDSNDYFGDKVNGLLLADSSGKIADAYFFTADSFKIKTSYYDFFEVFAGSSSLGLKYTILYADDAGKNYLDSIETNYWNMHKELARPNEDRFGFSNLPADYVDTIQAERSFRIISGKLQRF